MNNIKSFPFSQLSKVVQLEYKNRYNVALQEKISAAETLHAIQLNNRVKRIKSLNTSESDEGISEYLSEQHGAFNPTNITISSEESAEIHAAARKAAVLAFVDKVNIATAQSWLPQQLLAHFGDWKAVKNDSNKYDPLLTYEANCTSDEFNKGSLIFAISTSRADIIRSEIRGFQQYKSAINPLVPIILAGFKRSQNIQYMQWDKNGLERLVDNDLYQAMNCTPVEISNNELIEIRTNATRVLSGARKGKLENPVSCVRITGTPTTPLAHVPKLAKYMLMQTWCAHPTNRTPLGIYDPTDWDNVPPALVPSEVFEQVEEPAQNFTVDYPW
jgi:hypothetical protein